MCASLRAAPSVPLLAGTAAYSVWLLEPTMATGLPPLSSYVSELAAEGQPYAALLRTTDLAAGCLFVLAGVLGVRDARRARREARAGWGALALFGAATVADSRLPLSCTPTADAACAAREAAGDVPFAHTAHAYTSSLALLFLLTAAVLLTLSARRTDRGGALARWGPPLVAAQLLCVAWEVTAALGPGGALLGLAQRTQLALSAAWLVPAALNPPRGRRAGGPS